MERQSRKKLNLFVLKLLSLTRPYSKKLLLALVFLLFGTLVNLFLPQIARKLVDSEAGQLALQKPALTVLLIFLIFAAQNLFFYFRSSLFYELGLKVAANLRQDLFKALIKKPLTFHDTHDWMDTRSRLVSDIQLIQDAISLRLSIFIRYSLQIIISAVCMFFISYKLSLLAILLVPALGLAGALMGKKLKTLSLVSQQKLAITNGDAQEGLGQIRLVKLLSAENAFINRFAQNNKLSAESSLARARFAAVFSSSMNFLLTVSIAMVILFGLNLLQQNYLSKGDFTAFSLYGVILAVSFGFAISAYSELVQASAAGERVFPLLEDLENNDSLPQDSLNYVSKPENFIEFKDLCFNYPSRPESQVFNKLNFSLQANSCTAIVGPSGAGKSSIINLILGLYKPQSGSILINQDLIKGSDLQQALAIVPQDGFLISGTLRDNLCMGNCSFTEDKLRESLRKVGLLSLLESVGFDQDLGERGSQLSGGQKQRLAIARALLKSPRLLILDEASSALDTESERILLELIQELKKTCTILLITHRISSLSVADKILVFVKGKLAQQGTYPEVVNSAGVFKTMLDNEMQLS